MKWVANFAKGKAGYVLAFALGAMANHFFGTQRKPPWPAWVDYVLPFVIFAVFWIYLMIQIKRHEEK